MLSLDLHTNLLEMKRLPSLSSIESSIKSEEGSGGQQMSPELLKKKKKKRFQQNPHNSYIEDDATGSVLQNGTLFSPYS